MKKKILLPTDFSSYAWNAISYAIELYKDEPCEFYILNTFRQNGYVLESMMVPEPGEALYEASKKASEEGLEKIKNQIIATKGANPNHEFKYISKLNFLLESIKFIVEQHDISMIIMGTKGITDSSKIVYGSNTVDVMEKIRICPVLAIPKEAKVEFPKEIVFPTDFKTPIKSAEISKLIDIAKKSKAEIRVLRVVDNENNILDNSQQYNRLLLRENLSSVKHEFHTIVSSDRITGINCYVESRESDMIAFVNKKHFFFGSILSRPLVKNLGYYSKVPVLALHNFKN